MLENVIFALAWAQFMGVFELVKFGLKGIKRNKLKRKSVKQEMVEFERPELLSSRKLDKAAPLSPALD